MSVRAENKDLGTTLYMLLASVRLHLHHRLFIGTLSGFNHPGRVERGFVVLAMKSLEHLLL